MSDPPPTSQPQQVHHVHDCLIIGLGFSGTYLLHKLLKLGYDVVAVDPNDQLGGVWNHNIYPGARVDISVPNYQLGIPELHEHEPWEWSEKYPSGEELRDYFRWVQNRLDLKSKCEFGVWVERCQWQEDEGTWLVTATGGEQWKARWLLPCLGYAAAPLKPEWPGLHAFEGTVIHSAQWRQEGIDLRGKRVGVVGTGASGVQIVQTIPDEVESLAVFQRTPATAVPMQQRKLETGELTKVSLADRKAMLEDRKTRWDGSPSSVIMRLAKEDTPAQREAEFERLWQQGGFAFWTSNYMDLFVDQESNALVYDFWKRKVRSRIHSKSLQELLAPDKQPYAFGTKRVPLEQGYYEAFNRKIVSLIDLQRDEIEGMEQRGVKLTSGKLIELDMLILATGFDISTGSFTQIDIRGVNEQQLADKWNERTQSFLGMCVSGFPNMLFSYGPQSPSNTCNGPVCAEVQGDWIVDLLEHAKDIGKPRWEANADAQQEYTNTVTSLLKGTLFGGTKSYYHRDNIQPKEQGEREPIFWMGGLPAYSKKLDDCRAKDYQDFRCS